MASWEVSGRLTRCASSGRLGVTTDAIVINRSNAAMVSGSASTDPLVRQFLHGEPDGPIAFDRGDLARTEAAR